MKKYQIIIAALCGYFVASMFNTPIVTAAKGIVIYAANIASNAVVTAKINAKAVTAVKIQGGALNTIPISDADGGVSWGVAPTGATGATGATGPTGTVGTGSANRIVCWKTASTLGYCSTESGQDGGVCTCN